MKTTPNYNLIKPEQDDFYDVDDFNTNADIIDKELHETQKVTESKGKPNGLATLGEDGKVPSDQLPPIDDTQLKNHIDNKNNPHGVTKAQVGLSNVDNTADANKNVASAARLTTQRTIDGVNFDGSVNISHYGECTTAIGTTAKTVVVTGFVRAIGAKVTVKFVYGNTASAPTLNVNGTGATAMYSKGVRIGSVFQCLEPNGVYEFVYTANADGSNNAGYELVRTIASCYGECSITPSTTAKSATVPGFMLSVGARVVIRFVYGNSATTPTLNVNSSGAFGMYSKGVRIGSALQCLEPNGIYEFIYTARAGGSGVAGYELVGDEVVTKAPLTSPAFTGTPTAPTPAVTTNSTRLATTAFVRAAIDTYSSTIVYGSYKGNADNNKPYIVEFHQLINLGFKPSIVFIFISSNRVDLNHSNIYILTDAWPILIQTLEISDFTVAQISNYGFFVSQRMDFGLVENSIGLNGYNIGYSYIAFS
jgi:hypothetical protein